MSLLLHGIMVVDKTCQVIRNYVDCGTNSVSRSTFSWMIIIYEEGNLNNLSDEMIVIQPCLCSCPALS